MSARRLSAPFRWSAIIGLPLAITLATNASCQDEPGPNCFNGLKIGDRIAMTIVSRTDGPSYADAAGFACGPALGGPQLGVNVGDTLYATLTSSEPTSQCVGFNAALAPPTGLPVTPVLRGAADSTDANEIFGLEDFSSPCQGWISFDLRFETAGRPLSIPVFTGDPEPATAFMSFSYAGAAGDSSTADCPRSCTAGLHVSVAVIRK